MSGAHEVAPELDFKGTFTNAGPIALAVLCLASLVGLLAGGYATAVVMDKLLESGAIAVSAEIDAMATMIRTGELFGRDMSEQTYAMYNQVVDEIGWIMPCVMWVGIACAYISACFVYTHLSRRYAHSPNVWFTTGTKYKIGTLGFIKGVALTAFYMWMVFTWFLLFEDPFAYMLN